MIIYSLINMKGGVGKTTISTNLAVEFAKKGLKVLFIDNDEQSNSSLFFDVVNKKMTLTDLYINPEISLKKISYDTQYENIKCIPAGLDLNDILTLYLSDDKYAYKNIDKRFILKNKLLEIEDEYDICIMDNHPGMTVATYNGLMAANKVLIITTTDIYAEQGLKAMLEYFSSIKEERKKDDIYYDESILDKSLNLEGCLVNKYIYNPNFTKRKEYNYLKTNIRMVPRNKMFLLDKAVIEHKAAVEIMPKSNFAKDIKRLANELIDNIIK